MDIKIYIDLNAPIFIIGNTNAHIDEIPVENIEILALACTNLEDNNINVKLYKRNNDIKISEISYKNTKLKGKDISKSLKNAILNNVRTKL